jgi:hypothetical protein
MRRAETPPHVGSDWLDVSALPLCAPAPYDEAAHARAALAQLAAETRARGALRARAQLYPSDARPAWAESLVGSGPWSPQVGEGAVRRLARAILSRFEDSGAIGAALGWGDAADEKPLLRGGSARAISCGR